MRLLLSLLLLGHLFTPCFAQEATWSESSMSGYLIQTAITPESLLITNTQELEAFVAMLPEVTPFKVLPAPANPDPFLRSYSPDFQESILVVAIGRDRINDPPRFQDVEILEDGTRQVRFALPERTAGTYPFGWGVYTAIILPRTDLKTRVVVISSGRKEAEGVKRGDFKNARFKRL